jgi:alpha-beta hydrolase superfamily lysophospholipase
LDADQGKYWSNAMEFRLESLIRYLLRLVGYGSAGAVVVLIIVFVAYMESRPDLSVWHLADLDEEFRADSGVETFADYLALEDRLFNQLDARVYSETPLEAQRLINRYSRGSLSDPGRWARNWNRSFELSAAAPKAGALLLHGMSDSPYSLRALGERLNAEDMHIVGLRLPGHGTAPSGLVEVSWEDMAAAVRLALRHLAVQVRERPLYIVGYSNGAALAVHYALATLEDNILPKVDKLVLLSPAVGVTPAAAFAVWQARLGHLLGLEKLAWNAILPEYDPYKYGSFAVNAGDVVYRLTREIQQSLTSLAKAGKLDRFPPVLAFASVVDATVSTAALVDGLFERLPEGGHELVLFDIDRISVMGPILNADPAEAVKVLWDDIERPFTLSLVTNATAKSRSVISRSRRSGENTVTELDLGLSWPDDLYSLSHVALPFPPDDPLYGGHTAGNSPGIRLGDMALRGERGVLQIPASDMLRLRWNPFYPYVESRILSFVARRLNST